MLLLILLFTAITLCVAFFSGPQTAHALSPLSAYLETEINFLANNLYISILMFLALSAFSLKSLRFDKNYRFHRKLLFSGVYVLSSAVIGFFASFVLLFLIAVIQLNILSVLTATNKEALGIKTSSEEIVESLGKNSRPPEIITTNKNSGEKLKAIAKATSGTTNLYGASILQSVPSFLTIPPNIDSERIMLLDNVLIVSEINAQDIQVLSPVVGFQLVKRYFPTRRIKASAKVSIMDPSEYQKHRISENAKKIALIDEELIKLEEQIASVSATIESGRNLLSASQSARVNSSSERVSTTDVTREIEESENTLDDMLYRASYFNLQKQLLLTQGQNSPHENGIFVPDDSIRIVFKTSSPHAIADFFATLTHEYLHFASYSGEEQRLTDSFFEEGLTEYFARKMIRNSLNTSTNLGYPLHAKIISQMTNLIPETEFAEIYFTKDQESLERALDRVYGDGFYRRTQISFERLHYSPNPSEVLSIANSIMKEIGGSELNEQDLMSTKSNL
jgi:hypothetical protein